MSSSLRLSEKWFNRGLWLVALLFAYFLIGLGGVIVGDLPKVEKKLSIEDFIDATISQPIKEEIQSSAQIEKKAQDDLEQAELKLNTAKADYQAARQTFDNWLATRQVTKRSEQDAELIKKTSELEEIRQRGRLAEAYVETQNKILLDARQNKQKSEAKLSALKDKAQEVLHASEKKQELRVFFYRLALTLPLLLIAIFLFIKQRKTKYWPFVWGFIIFAVFAFFVELVPYLPSYGGYVRYLVGIILTLVGGRYVIVALNKYLEQQKQVEKLPDVQRKSELSYDLALTRLGKGVCPSCERPFHKENDKYDYCQHCGIHLFDRCSNCQTRKSAFTKFCFCCGKSAHQVAST